MAYQMNELQGSLFTNRDKNVNDPNDRRPHVTGHCKINGQEYEVSGWWRYTQAGDAYLSLAFQLPWEQRKQQLGYQQQGARQEYQRPAQQQRPAPQPPQQTQQQRRTAAPPIPPAPMPEPPSKDNPADDLPF